MNTKTIYTFNNVDSCYVNYSNEVEFTSSDGDVLTVVMDEAHLESLRESIDYRLERAKTARLEKLLAYKEELESANTDTDS